MKNKSTLTFYTFLLSISISLFSFNQIIAQEDNGIYEISNSNKSELSKGSSKKGEKNNRDGFYNLAFKLHSTSYVENNGIKSNKKSQSVSKLTFIDTKSFNILNNSNNSDFENVELITIVIRNKEDLNNKLNLNDINGFNSLKYIYVKCYFKCTEQQINEFLNSDADIRIFYKTETPS